MRKIERLRKKALESCKFRGHKMGPFFHWKFSEIAKAHCIKCGAEVIVSSKPLPNDIEISGRAVAVYCNIQP